MSLKKNKITNFLSCNNIGKRNAHFSSFRTIIFVSCDTCARQCKKVIQLFKSTYLEFNLARSLRRNLIITIWFLVFSYYCPNAFRWSLTVLCINTNCSTFFLILAITNISSIWNRRLLVYYLFDFIFLKNSSFNRKTRGSKC